MKILACQIAADGVVTHAAMEAHQQRVAARIRSVCKDTAVDLVFLPELSAIEYSRAAFDNLEDLATATDGWLFSSMAELAREIDTPICFGMPRRDRGSCYISQVTIARDGSLLGCYDKVHIAQFGASIERPYFTPGKHICVFDAGRFRFGVVICYDMRFADYVAAVAREHHIDVMLHPVAFSRDGSFASWPSFVRTRALENQVYWLSLNRAGAGQGHSIFCPPWFERDSDVLELDETETFQLIEVDRAKLEYAASSYPLGKDRLESYACLNAPHREAL